MKNAPLTASLLLLFLLGTASPSLPQQTQKRPKSALASGIDSAASGALGGAKASPVAEDGEFLRRVMLDLVGYPPSLEQVKEFIANSDPNKRADKIDQLIDSDEWSDRTARLFCEGWFGDYHKIPMDKIMPVVDAGSKDRLVSSFISWLKLKLSKDAPYNREIVDQILRARGTGTGDPALLWKLACFNGDDSGPIEFANRISKHFLGIRLKCAQCHDHPFDKWETHDFYRMAAFFSHTKVTGGTEIKLDDMGEGEGLKATGSNYQPQFLYGQKPGKTDVWMDAAAVYTTTGDNGQLASAVCNRIWSWLFGRGLVHPVDDFNKMQQPLSAGILGVLGKELRSTKYSIKSVYRGICNSDTYQRASANEAKLSKPGFAAAWIKHLDAEQLLNSVQVATTGKPSKDVGSALRMVEPLFPADVVWCEVTPLPGNMRQALLVRNNSQINGMISGGGILSTIRGGSTAEKVTDMFLAALSRKPSASELDRFSKFIDGHQGQGMEDAYWAILNTTEFLSRH